LVIAQVSLTNCMHTN